MKMTKLFAGLAGVLLVAGLVFSATVDTGLAPLKGASASGNKLQVYQRTIDFSGAGALASNTYYRVFDLDAGDVVVGGSVSVTATNTAGATTFDLGRAGGDTILDGGSLAAVAVLGVGSGTSALTSAPIGTNYVTIIGNDAISNAVVDITLLVLKSGDTSGN